MRATIGCGSRRSLEDGAGEFPNTRVDIHTIEEFRVEGNFGFQMSLEVGPVSAHDVSRSGGQWEDKRHLVSMNTRR